MDVYPSIRFDHTTACREVEVWARLEGKSPTASADLLSDFAPRTVIRLPLGGAVARLLLHLAMWSGEAWALG